MMDWNEHISDEALAAFIDGNATPLEKYIIGNNLGNDELQELLEIVSDVKTNPELFEMNEKSLDDVIDNGIDDLNRIKTDVENSKYKIM